MIRSRHPHVASSISKRPSIRRTGLLQKVVGDLDILSQNVAIGSTHHRLDLNDDDIVDLSDIRFWVTDLKNTWIGDANLDGEVNSGDFVQVFSAGKYETDEMARWNEGDWNADERFDSGDFVAAFQGGGYEVGQRPATAAVPEPSCWILAATIVYNPDHVGHHTDSISA